MPTHRLTLPADQLATAVEAVLRGAPLPDTAAEAGLDPTDLAEAVDTYRAAGLAALQHRQDGAWFQARVALPDWNTAEAVLAADIAPRLDQFASRRGWWFLCKHPYLRLRIRTSDHRAAEALLDEIVAAGTIAHWRPGIYEPEAAAFGGVGAMAIVHDLFCADSQGVLTYARQPTPEIGRRELSLLLIRALQQHAGLDWYEAGDVFDRVARTRPAPADAARVDTLAATMQPLLGIPIRPHLPPFAPGGPLGYAIPWLAAFAQAGQHLGHAAAAGDLDRGLRATLAHAVIFHWNRLGLSAAAQGVLAHAARTALLPRS